MFLPLLDLPNTLALRTIESCLCHHFHQESGKSGALFLAESHGLLSSSFPFLSNFCADVHLGGEELQRNLEHDCSLTQQNKCSGKFCSFLV